MIENFDNIFQQLLTALQAAEKRHRAVRDSASDNSDWDTLDKEVAIISNIIKWRRNLEPIRAEILESGAMSNEDISTQHMTSQDIAILSIKDDTQTYIEKPPESDDEIKVGKYIRGKLRKLSESGFRFSSEQMRHICDVNWCRKIFTYDRILPFAKLINVSQDISSQTKDENGKNRYWNEIFTFGDDKLLIFSQWYAKDKESFDKWYKEIKQSKLMVARDTLIFEKKVDWSTLNYGVSIPAASWEIFYAAIGGIVNSGERREITIDILNNCYPVSISHTISGATNTVQIRYSQNSELVSVLRRIFSITFDYCTSERSRNVENSRVIIPVELEESIEILATGTSDSLKFVCKPRESGGDVSQSMTSHKTITIHAKQKNNGDNIVEVSDSFVPILEFPDKNILVCAKLNIDTQMVSFRAEVDKIPYAEKSFPVTYLVDIASLESHERIHRIEVPKNVNVSRQMMFMAWIDSNELNTQKAKQEINIQEIFTARTKPTKIMLFGKEYPVKAWNEMFIKICEIMLLHSPYVVAALDKDAEFNTDRRTNFSYVQSEIKYSGKRLSNGLWIETNQNSSDTVNKCRRIIEKCGFSPDELKFEIMEVAQ